MARPATLFPRLIEVLAERRRWETRTAIADAVGVAPGSLAPWLNHLTFFGAIREQHGEHVVVLPRLLSTATAFRVANLRPERPRPVTWTAEELRDRLVAEGVVHAFGMFTAANQWAFHEPHQDLHLYIERNARGRVLDLVRQAQPAPRGRGPRLQLYCENLDGLGHQDRAGLRVTTPFQTIIDLRAHPEGGAHAAFLEEHLLPRLADRPHE